jgi:site-specific recombinase XerD
MEFIKKLPQLAREYVNYKHTIEGKSKLSVKEYAYDLQTFFRYLAVQNGDKSEWRDIDVSGFGVDDLKKLVTADFYEYLMFLSDKMRNSAVTRSRKLAALRTFFTYLVDGKKVLEENPVKGIEGPKLPKRVPKFLELSESKQLLNAVGGEHAERDFFILTILLNCGLRVGELQNLKISDIKPDRMTVTGKGDAQTATNLIGV